MITLGYIAIGLLAINFIYYLLFVYFGYSKNPQPTTSKIYPVSLVVCSKNEAENLKKHIPVWLDQDHPDFELVLIDDASADDTATVISDFAAADPRISPVYVKANERFLNSKKYALTLGIKKARHARLIFTDADCKPVHNSWLSSMSKYFSASKHLVLGYSPYERKFSLLNALIRFETFVTAMQYFAYAKAGKPYMGVGRNLAYTSVLFEKHKGFASHMQVQSGDDDLFVNQVANAQNTTSCLEPTTFTISTPKSSFSAWIRQKRRHVSTANHYKGFNKFCLGIYYLSNLGFWAVLTLLFLQNYTLALLILGIRILGQWTAYYGAAKKLKCRDLLLASPLLELFLICVQLSIFSANILSPKPTWK